MYFILFTNPRVFQIKTTQRYFENLILMTKIGILILNFALAPVPAERSRKLLLDWCHFRTRVVCPQTFYFFSQSCPTAYYFRALDDLFRKKNVCGQTRTRDEINFQYFPASCHVYKKVFRPLHPALHPGIIPFCSSPPPPPPPPPTKKKKKCPIAD